MERRMRSDRADIVDDLDGAGVGMSAFHRGVA
jgi:hypothetical protein